MNIKSIIWRDFTRKCKDTRGRFRVPIVFTTIIKFCAYATRCRSPESGLSHTHRWLLVLKGDKRKNISSALEG